MRITEWLGLEGPSKADYIRSAQNDPEIQAAAARLDESCQESISIMQEALKRCREEWEAGAAAREEAKANRLYIVCEAKSQMELETAVSDYLRQGWQLSGGLQLSTLQVAAIPPYGAYSRVTYYQAVVKAAA